MSTRDVPAQAGGLPPPVGRPANSTRLQAGVTFLAEAALLGRRKLVAMHGIGPKFVRLLDAAALERGHTFEP